MTPNKEDYLKCLYELGTRHNKITNKEIAQLMQVSPPAVTEMMKKLSWLPLNRFGAKISFRPLS